MMIDWTISAGNVIQLVALLGAAFSVFYGLSYRLKAVEKEMEKLSNVVVTLAVQTTEIAHLRKRIDDLSEVSRVNFEDYPPAMRRQKM
jgi:cell division protein FtsX